MLHCSMYTICTNVTDAADVANLFLQLNAFATQDREGIDIKTATYTFAIFFFKKVRPNKATYYNLTFC